MSGGGAMTPALSRASVMVMAPLQRATGPLVQAPSHSVSAAFTASGCSRVVRWPLSGTTMNLAPAMPTAISLLSSGGAKFIVVPDSGHLTTLEQPEAVNAALTEW